MGGLLHLVQREGAWADCGLAQFLLTSSDLKGLYKSVIIIIIYYVIHAHKRRGWSGFC